MFARLLAVALTLAFPAYAQTLPEPQSDTVSDYADVLDATAEGRISRLLVEMREATGVQMVVVTMPGIAAQGADQLPLRSCTSGKKTSFQFSGFFLIEPILLMNVAYFIRLWGDVVKIFSGLRIISSTNSSFKGDF